MPKITAISPQKRKGRFNIYIDREFAFGIDEDTLVQESLIVGKDISELEIGKLEEKSEVGKLYQKALHFLEYRPRSEREVQDYLNKKTAAPEIADRILKKLKQLNYLNDEEFAKWWVEQRRNNRNPRGIRVIQSELYRKGVASSVIKAVLQANEKPATRLRSEGASARLVAESAEECAEDAEMALAAKAAEAYLKRLKQPKLSNNPWELKRKLGAYLARRGFEWDTIKITVDKLTTEE